MKEGLCEKCGKRIVYFNGIWWAKSANSTTCCTPDSVVHPSHDPVMTLWAGVRTTKKIKPRGKSTAAREVFGR